MDSTSQSPFWHCGTVLAIITFVTRSTGFLVKSLDWCSKKSITVVDWHTASHAAEERTCFHHSEAQAEALAMHHKIIMDLDCTHSWEVAIEYDIQHCKPSSLNPTHDLSLLNTMALTVIATHASIQQLPTPTPTPTFSLLKHQVTFEVTSWLAPHLLFSLWCPWSPPL